MATAELNRGGFSFGHANDAIVIINALGDIPGGRTLDVTGFPDEVITAGHPVIKTAAGEYAPLGLTTTEGGTVEYAELSKTDVLVGVVKATVSALNPQVGIMTIGQVCAAAMTYPVTDAIKAALPRIEFL